ncbi:MAG: phosphodiester glycosidase family protein [Clostridia bacterium]
MNSQKRPRLFRGYLFLILDAIALGVALCVFSLFHHVLPMKGGGPIQSVPGAKDIITQTVQSTPEAQLSPTDLIQSTPEPALPATGDFSQTFPSNDTGTNAVHSYQSDSVRIAVNQVQRDSITYYVADVWIRNISSFKTAFAKDEYGRGIHEQPVSMAHNNNALIAVNGDYYGARDLGVVIRNGDVYRNSISTDVCVVYADGVMETIAKDDFSIDAAIARGAYQAWSFGPKLLLNGQPIATFNSSVEGANPRTAIGYYQPGHYCLVTVDGRQPGYSAGMTMQKLSMLFYELGCADAYNLDGGQSSMMVFQDELVNKPFKGGRQSSDIIYFTDPAAK